MRSKLYLLLSILFFSYSNAQKNCNLYEVPLSQRASVSTLIVEGIVKSSIPQWDRNRKKIFTIHEVELTSVLKGNPTQNTIKIVTQGGTIDLTRHTFTNELELKVGDAGIFFLKESSYDIGSDVALYMAPSFAQSFIKYQKEDKSARGPFDNFESTDELENQLKKIPAINFSRIKEIPWDEIAGSRIHYESSRPQNRNSNETQSVLATISGFTPTTVQAGRDVQLTITGTGFGATQGTSYVAFKNANDGGGSYVQPYAPQYVSWSDTQIVVKVPSDAGTGNIRVNVGGTNTNSAGTLTVDYAIIDLEYTFNSVTTEYTSLLRNQNGSGGYTFKYTADVPASGKTYFEIAAKDWVCATGVDFLVSTTASAATSIADDNENTVDYQALGTGSGVIAQATTYSGGCVVGGTTVYWFVDELDVIVNSSLTYYYGTGTSFSGYDYYTAVLHELGHADQLGHVIDTNASPTKIMHYSLGAGQYRRAIDTGALNGGLYWVGQSTTSTRCSTTAHRTLYCTSAVTLTTSVASIAESGTSFTVTATQNQINFSDVVVSFSYSGTATSGSDYTNVASITIPAGNLTASGTITVTNDNLYEGNETVIIDISSVTNGTENGTQQKTVTINDDDTAPTVTLTTGTSAIAETSGSTTVTATLSAVSGLPVTVNLGLTGTATTTTDYTLATTITIPAGSTSANITLAAVGDALDESNETVIIDITSVTNGTESGTQQQTVSITDDDATPTVTLSTGSATIAENAGTTTVIATLSAISGQDVTVNLAFTGTATLSNDYTLATSVSIPAGNTSASITLTAVNDVFDESNETVIIDIASVTNGTESGVQQKTVTITDDDAAPSVTLTIGTATIAESAGSTTVTATLSAVSGQDVTVNVTLTGTATLTADYTLATTITIPAGSASASNTVAAVSDILDEANETIIIDISSVTNGTESGVQQQTVTITDDDTSTVTLSSGAATIIETAGVTTVTATLSAASYQAITVNLTMSGTATLTVDYTLGASITIPAGSTSASINLSSLSDTMDENNETVIIDIASVTNGLESGTQQSTVTITDDDLSPIVTLSSSNLTVSENGSSNATITLSAVSGLNVIVNLQFSGTATFNNDYILATNITVPAGSTSATAPLFIVNDAIDEPNETVIVDVGSVTNGRETVAQQLTYTIVDDDEALVTITTGAATIAETAGSTTVTATLSTVSSLPVTVDLGLTGFATAGIDYTLATSITIPAGDTSASITLASVSDAMDESNETITIDVISVTNATESGTQQQTVAIIDDDEAPTVSLSTGNLTIAENGATNIIVTLSAVSGQNVMVALSASGTATMNSDYTFPGLLTIPAGNTSAIINLSAIEDAVDEPDETVIVDIMFTGNATELGTQQLTYTIIDNDISANTIVNLKLFIEGYYDSGSMMQPVMHNQDFVSPITNVENITVELRDVNFPYGILHTTTAMLKTDGTVQCTYESAPNGLFYIAVKTRNALQTWSSSPVTVGITPLTYDFSSDASKAFSNNMKQVGAGVYAFYSGDINQDGNIDTIDYPIWEIDSNNFATGSVATDLNGDGNVDTIDFPVWQNNSDNFIFSIHPE